jgi:hypothetical protein
VNSKWFVTLSICAFLYSVNVVANDKWVLDSGKDPLTDAKVVTARSSYTEGIVKKFAVVRCVDKKLEIFFDFGEFLGDKNIPVRYRFDSGQLYDREWPPSADGTAVFSDFPEIIGLEFMKDSKFIIEATDFRGVPHRDSFELTDGHDAIKAVMASCDIVNE